ncbi:hypothetical protein CRUP_015524, partial [Coryphaenoides rupestris]
FAEGSRGRWIPSVPREVCARVCPQVPLHRCHAAAAAGAEHRPSRDRKRPHSHLRSDPGHHGPGGLHGRRVLHHVWREGGREEVFYLQDGMSRV